jgi:hypothetical protein
MFVLHPDEPHDGQVGTEADFRYRIVYVDPRLVAEALGDEGCPLPFVREAVSDDKRLAAAIVPALEDLDLPLEDLHHDQIVLHLADALATADKSVRRRTLRTSHWDAVSRARDFLAANVETELASAELEAVTRLTRYALARQFRACMWTSPYRFLVMRGWIGPVPFSTRARR